MPVLAIRRPACPKDWTDGDLLRRVLRNESAAWNELVKRNRAVAVVFGYGVDELSKMQEMKLPVPAFYPLAGMDEKEIEERLKGIGG